MKRLWILIVFLFIAGCSSLPVIHQPPASNSKTTCPSVFPAAPTRFIHAIEVRLAGQTRAVMTGVTLVDPAARMMSCAVVTVEGLMLFEATSDSKTIKINRALPPFDAPDFARNMLEDISLIFLAPQGVLHTQGYLADGRLVCRWNRTQEGWVDVIKDKDQQVSIQRYDKSGRPERTVIIGSREAAPYASIELQAPGPGGYTLLMTLIESEAASGSPGRQINSKTEGKTP